MFQMTADPIGFLDYRVEIKFGDLLNQAIVISLPVLQH